MRGGEGIMAAHHQQQHHRPVPPLKVPPRPTPRSFSFSHSGFSPSPSFSSSRSPFVSPSPTPKPRPRPPEAPAWLTILLHTVPLYIAHAWLASHSSSSSSTTIVFAFLALLGSAVGFRVLQQQRQPWQGSSSSSSPRSIALAQWGLLFGNGLLIAASTLLKLEGVRSCGPLVAVLAEYAGSVLGKFVLGDWASSSPGRIRGLLATAIGLLLLAQGWTTESCSPLAIKERMTFKMGKCGTAGLPLWAPMAAGVLSACAKLMSTRTSLKWITKKRVHGLSTICAAVLMFPLALLQLDSLALVHASAWWPLSSMIMLGLAQSVRGDAHFEEKLLIPPGSPRHFAITCCCASLLELWFGLDISPLGFLACSALLALGVRELADPGTALSLEAIAKHEAQASLWALVKGPLRLITSDAKSGKIAAFLAMNAAFMVVEFAFGFTSNSLGLVSDACHMLFDCAALAIGLYASYISKLQPSSGFGYGYGRFEVLSGYANAVFLVLVASLIVLESIERILDPPEISTESLLVVSLGGLLVNLVGLVFFHEEHHHSHGGSCSSHSHDHSATTKLVQQEELSINLEPRILADHSGGYSSSALQELSSPAVTADSGHALADPLAMEKQGFHQSHHSHCRTQQQHSDEQLKHRSCDHHHQHSDQEQCSSSHQHHHSDHQHSPDHHHENSAHSHHHPDQQHSPNDHHESSAHSHHHPDHQHSDHEQLSSDHQHSPNHHDNSAHQHPNSAHSHQSDHHHSPNHHENSAHQHHHHQGNSAHSQHSCEHHGHSLNHHSHADDEHHDHSHHHESTTEDAHHHIDHNMRGIFLHVLADTLGSVGVVISTLLIKYKGWMFTDPACSIFISVMIIASVIPLLINSGEILLQRTPRSTQKRLKEALEKIRHLQGVQGLERLHVWSFTNNEIVGTLHLHASTGTDKSMLRDKASRLLNNVGITDMTIQVEDM